MVDAGCVTDRWLEGHSARLSIEEYQARYSNFGDPWVGLQVEDLIASRGPPDDVLEAKPRWTSFTHDVHVLSYIYYSGTDAGRSCIDAFVVVEDTGTVIKYYCR
jgi:hypothetical protein